MSMDADFDLEGGCENPNCIIQSRPHACEVQSVTSFRVTA